MSRLVLKNFRIVDEAADFFGTLIVKDGYIEKIIRITEDADTRQNAGAQQTAGEEKARCVIDGNNFPGAPVLMPAFIDLHAHFRDSGTFAAGAPLPDETLESGALAAARGGYGTVICMANTRPVIDTAEKARVIKERCDSLGLIDLYPVVSLTKNMEGFSLCEIEKDGAYVPLMLSEDGKDVASDELFLAAMKKARDLGIPVSCHCDFGGQEAEATKANGGTRAEWSRIEENNAVRRAIALGRTAGCHIHIAHVSTKESADFIRYAKQSARDYPGFTLSCEATPHHIGAAEADARRMGEETFGRVNPPLRAEADRRAIIAALRDGTIDAIATDHAPHSETGKAAGAPGFTGLETAFSVCLSALTDKSKMSPNAAVGAVANNAAGSGTADAAVGGETSGANSGQEPGIDLRRLSALMSANPARVIALDKSRGRIAEGLRADLVIADIQTEHTVNPDNFASRGKCGPFNGRTLRGKILAAIHNGRLVFENRV